MADSDAEAEPFGAIPSTGKYNAAATSLLYLVCICNNLLYLVIYLQQAYCTLRLVNSKAGADTLEENISDTLDEDGTGVTPEGDNYSLYMYTVHTNNNYYTQMKTGQSLLTQSSALFN